MKQLFLIGAFLFSSAIFSSGRKLSVPAADVGPRQIHELSISIHEHPSHAAILEKVDTELFQQLVTLNKLDAIAYNELMQHLTDNPSDELKKLLKIYIDKKGTNIEFQELQCRRYCCNSTLFCAGYSIFTAGMVGLFYGLYPWWIPEVIG